MSPLLNDSKLSRRTFLKSTSIASGGLILGFFLPRGVKAAAEALTPVGPFVPNAFLRIGPDGIVTVLVKNLEFGQGVLTSLAMIAAEELDCDWSQVRSEHSPVTPAYHHAFAPMQFTGGSMSVATSWMQLRQAGATARAMLVEAAAKAWDVKAEDCRTENGIVVSPNGERAAYGDLVAAASTLTPPTDVPLKSSFKIVGTPRHRLDGKGKTDGTAFFGMDVSSKEVPDLHVAVVARSPAFGGSLKAVDDTATLEVPGVVAVYPITAGVAVVAKDFWSAKKGRDALKLEWDTASAKGLSTDDLVKQWRDVAKQTGTIAKEADAASAMEAATERIEAEYDFPYLAHAPMEPLNCTVLIKDDHLTLWAGTQFQTMDQGAAARTAGLTPEQVEVKTLLAGGGFGRRANPVSDYIVEAVEIAKAAKLPIKLMWTREDDIRGGYYRPLCVHRVEIGLSPSKHPVAWDHTIVTQSILTGTAFESMMVKNGIDETSVEGVSNTPYALKNMRVSLHSPNVAVPVLWWRSVGHTHTAYVMETLVDELAAKAERDPVEFRRELLAEHPRHLRVLELLAEKANWGTAPTEGTARGLAIHESFNSVVGEVADVSIENGKIRVHRVVAAVDCGTVVNPLGAESQVQSAIAYGLSAALHGKLTITDGQVAESNFNDYPILRIEEMPKVEVHFVPSSEPPTGLGEPGTPPIAPAVANALAKLTGKRHRSLPFVV